MPGEVVHGEVRDDLVAAGGGGADGEAGPDVGIEAVEALGVDGDAVDLAGGDEIVDVIDEGVGGEVWGAQAGCASGVGGAVAAGQALACGSPCAEAGPISGADRLLA